ncbi:hypothetical protein SAMN05660666_03449 [Novosphingobium aromaticivorans]|nr:hypothetical protein [Novosphingobium aromaticivorans]SCY89222.1 hypothetical protein SAMN05660666_03449 [Novosphingobium aromaticivorans]
MTAHAIHRNAHPMRTAMPLLPMDPEQARFLRLRRERQATLDTKGARS